MSKISIESLPEAELERFPDERAPGFRRKIRQESKGRPGKESEGISDSMASDIPPGITGYSI
jgi:hypothetical protein